MAEPQRKKFALDESRQEGMRRGYILLWIAGFVLHRGMVLTWGFNRTFFWEETYRLIVAEALVHGWNIPLLELQADPYAGGSLVMSLLAVPGVALLGPSIVALKWVALLWTAVGFLVWMLLIDRYFGRRAAHLFGLCFVLAPPLFVIYNLITMGSHAEVVTLSGVQFFLAFRYLYGGKRPNLSLLGWTVFAGLSVWFTYVSFLPFALCLLAALLAGALPVRRWPLVGGGFFLGMTPWIIYNIATGGSGLPVLFATFGSAGGAGPGSPGGYLTTLFDLIKAGIPAALRYQDLRWSIGGPRFSLPRELLSYSYLGIFMAAWFCCVWSCWSRQEGGRDRHSRGSGLQVLKACPEISLLLLFPLFVLLIAASNHGFNELGLVPFLAFRILVPALPAVFFTIALAGSRLSLKWCRGIGCVVAALGALAFGQLVLAGSSDRPRIEARARELGAQAMGHLLFFKHGADMPLIAERIAAMEKDLRAAAYSGIGFSLAYHYPEDAPVDGLGEELLLIEPAYRADAVSGIRLALGPGMEQVRPLPQSERSRAILAAINALDPPDSAQ